MYVNYRFINPCNLNSNIQKESQTVEGLGDDPSLNNIEMSFAMVLY